MLLHDYITSNIQQLSELWQIVQTDYSCHLQLVSAHLTQMPSTIAQEIRIPLHSTIVIIWRGLLARRQILQRRSWVGRQVGRQVGRFLGLSGHVQSIQNSAGQYESVFRNNSAVHLTTNMYYFSIPSQITVDRQVCSLILLIKIYWDDMPSFWQYFAFLTPLLTLCLLNNSHQCTKYRKYSRTVSIQLRYTLSHRLESGQSIFIDHRTESHGQ